MNILKHKLERIDNIYMNIAKEISKFSYAKRSKVGAIAVKNRQIIAEAYNGTPAGWDNICEDKDNVTKSEVLHAESNLISKLAKSTTTSDGATVYLTLSPCFECAKLLYQSGIKRVVYLEKYRKTDGIDFLEKCNVEVIKFKGKISSD